MSPDGLDILGDDLEDLAADPGRQSDSACSTTRSNCWSPAVTRMAHAMMMLIPEAWSGNPLMDNRRASTNTTPR